MREQMDYDKTSPIERLFALALVGLLKKNICFERPNSNIVIHMDDRIYGVGWDGETKKLYVNDLSDRKELEHEMMIVLEPAAN